MFKWQLDSTRNKNYWEFFVEKTINKSLAPRWKIHNGQLNSEWIYEVLISPKKQTKNYKDFFPTMQTRIIALFWWV